MGTSSRRDFFALSSLASIGALGRLQSASAQESQPTVAAAEKVSNGLDLSEIPIIDHHSHGHEADEMRRPKTWDFTTMFYHGYKDDGSMPLGTLQLSGALKYHISQSGVVLAAVAALSRLFECADTLEAVVDARNTRVKADLDGYIRFLYSKAGITGIVFDGVELNKPVPATMPAKVSRLVPNDAIFKESLAKSDSVGSFRKAFLDGIATLLKDKQYIAIKHHLGETATLAAYEIPVADVEAVFANAKKGDAEALRKVNMLSFNDLAHHCCEQGVPIHIHTGSSGKLPDYTSLANTLDPFLLAPYLQRPELKRLKVVLLHGGHPWMRNTALMVYHFPNVYMDVSWATPWNVLGSNQNLHEVMSMAPLSKIMYGSGCHTGADIAYLGAVVIRRILTSALSSLIEDQHLTRRQAEEIAHQILHVNAEKLYKI